MFLLNPAAALSGRSLTEFSHNGFAVGFLPARFIDSQHPILALSSGIRRIAPEAVLLSTSSFIGRRRHYSLRLIFVIPDTHVQWARCRPGAIVTALLFSVGKDYWPLFGAECAQFGLWCGRLSHRHFGVGHLFGADSLWVRNLPRFMLIGRSVGNMAGGGETDSVEKSPTHGQNTAGNT